MKKNLSIFSVMMAFMTLAIFSSCKEDDPVVTPEFDWVEGQNIVDNEIQAEAAGGTFAIQWKMNVDDAQIEAKSDVEWMTVQASGSEQMSKFGDGVLNFTVAENTEAEREGRITLSFIHPEEMADVVLTVKQAAGKEEEPEVPEDAKIVVEVSGINMTSIDVLAKPSHPKMQYLLFVATEEYFKLNGMLESDKAVVAADLSFMKRDAETFGESLEETFKFYIHSGDYKATLKGLTPQTSYIVYAYGAKLEGENLVNTTEVVRIPVRTKDFDKVPVTFEFEYEVGVDNASMTVTATDYDGYFYFDVLADCLDLEEAQTFGVQRWLQMVKLYKENMGFDNATILQQLCSKNTGTHMYAKLRGGKEYLGYAMAISDDCMPHSDVYGKTFKTGDVAASDNVIDIQITDIKDYSASVVLTPSNDDPYFALLYATKNVEGKTDEEIIDLCLQFVEKTMHGTIETEFTDLTPDCEYAMLCFGCESFTPTTKLFRKDFRTLPDASAASTASKKHSRENDVKLIGGTASIKTEAKVKASEMDFSLRSRTIVR